MPSARSIFARPLPRIALSVLGAMAAHVLIVAMAWPWIKPFVLPAGRGGEHGRIDRQAIEQAMSDTPIISGDVHDSVALADQDVSYASEPWGQTVAISPADARLPFSFVRAMNLMPRLPIGPPHPFAIAPQRNAPTIRP